ncbi:MAG: Hpt domain-containing protein [Pirellulales bacterium]
MTNAADVNDDFTDGLLSDFLDESTGLVGRLNENLLQLDQWTKAPRVPGERPMDLLNEMFRSAHSIKGLSGMLRLNDINVLTHKVENVFDAARTANCPFLKRASTSYFRRSTCFRR